MSKQHEVKQIANIVATMHSQGFFTTVKNVPLVVIYLIISMSKSMDQLLWPDFLSLFFTYQGLNFFMDSKGHFM